jgi:membrane-associated phospholipid phosphatase
MNSYGQMKLKGHAPEHLVVSRISSTAIDAPSPLRPPNCCDRSVRQQVIHRGEPPVDTTWYLDINRFAVHTAWLHGFMRLYAVYGVGIFALLVLAAWWYARSQADPPRAVAASIWAAAGTLIAVALNQIVVHAVNRPRPYLTLHGVEVLVSKSMDPSFPSDHTTTAGAAIAGLWIIAHYGGRPAKALATGGTLLALLLAFARVYVGAHYPGDVTAGLLIGAAITIVGWLVLKNLLTAAVNRIGTYRPLRPFVTTAGSNAPRSTLPTSGRNSDDRRPTSSPPAARIPADGEGGGHRRVPEP